MKRNAFTTVFAIAAIASSSLVTPCRMQIAESQAEGKVTEENVVYICEEVDEEMIFSTDGTQPEFTGGMPVLMEYLQKQDTLPKEVP